MNYSNENAMPNGFPRGMTVEQLQALIAAQSAALRQKGPLQARTNVHTLPKQTKHPSKAAGQPAPGQVPKADDDDGIGGDLEDLENCFTAVSTAELEKLGLKAHPDKIAETSALSSVAVPHCGYKMSCPSHILQST